MRAARFNVMAVLLFSTEPNVVAPNLGWQLGFAIGALMP